MLIDPRQYLQLFIDAAHAAYSRDVPNDLNPLRSGFGTPIARAIDTHGFYAEAFTFSGGIIISYEGTSTGNGQAYSDASNQADYEILHGQSPVNFADAI